MLFPVLDDSIAGLPLAIWLHYLSSLLGLAALIAWLVAWLAVAAVLAAAAIHIARRVISGGAER